VEIVGLAGAGKTTLTRTLCQRNEKIQVGVPLDKVRTIPFLLSNTLSLLPTFLRHYRHTRWFTWSEVRSMDYLRAWHHALARQSRSNDFLVVFDHGPIFRLALLREFGPAITRSELFEQWWDNVLNKWMTTLDIVVWLEAPLPIMLERAQDRGHWYLSGDISVQEGYEFLGRYQRAYEQILAQLTINQAVTLLRFNTDEKSPNQIADEVLVALESNSM
jgi:deoxyadenosine/deoxycytidine kinase